MGITPVEYIAIVRIGEANGNFSPIRARRSEISHRTCPDVGAESEFRSARRTMFQWAGIGVRAQAGRGFEVGGLQTGDPAGRHSISGDQDFFPRPDR